MKKIKKDTNHRNIVPAGGFVKKIGRRGILIAAGAILLGAYRLPVFKKRVEPRPARAPCCARLRNTFGDARNTRTSSRAERASVRTVWCSRGRKRTFVRAVLRRAYVIYRLQ